jgi:hypothetical protein
MYNLVKATNIQIFGFLWGKNLSAMARATFMQKSAKIYAALGHASPLAHRPGMRIRWEKLARLKPLSCTA